VELHDQSAMILCGVNRVIQCGEFFECHEVLEAVWTPERGPAAVSAALIHFAVGLYHAQRGTGWGDGQLRKGFATGAYLPECEGVDGAAVSRCAETLRR